MFNTRRLEALFEVFIWKFRLFTLLPVIFGLLSTLVFFIIGTLEVIAGISHNLMLVRSEEAIVTEIVSRVIGGIDYYLIGVVLLIFSFGIYELFISSLEVRLRHSNVKILRITTLDQLKTKILQVIVVALVVSFFKKAIALNPDTPLEMIYFAISILIIALSGYLLHLQSHPPQTEEE